MFELRTILLTGLAIAAMAASVHAYDYDANDFAVEVVRYDIGSGVYDGGAPYDLTYGFYDKPGCALGRPTVMTTMTNPTDPNDANEPVNPVYPAWRANEVVSIGKAPSGGEVALVVKFSHPVADDRNNPYGMDLIVFGNSRFYTDGPQGFWHDGDDPASTCVTYGLFAEPGIVSVSQDGITWYTYASPIYPKADSFAPTAAYRWDYEGRRWDVNSPLNPTRPVDPNLKPADLLGLTVSQAIDRYDGSAGGAAFDISVFGLEWIQYVKVSGDPGTSGTTEIDAVADVSACGDYRHPFPSGDLNYDCRVDFRDMAILGGDWLGHPSDMAAIAGNWLSCTWECD